MSSQVPAPANLAKPEMKTFLPTHRAQLSLAHGTRATNEIGQLLLPAKLVLRDEPALEAGRAQHVALLGDADRAAGLLDTVAAYEPVLAW